MAAAQREWSGAGGERGWRDEEIGVAVERVRRERRRARFIAVEGMVGAVVVVVC